MYFPGPAHSKIIHYNDPARHTVTQSRHIFAGLEKNWVWVCLGMGDIPIPRQGTFLEACKNVPRLGSMCMSCRVLTLR